MKIDILSQIENYIFRGLNVEFVNIENYYINLGNKDWSFYSDSIWRIIKDEGIEYSSEKYSLKDIQSLLINKSIINIGSLTNFQLKDGMPVDVFLRFSDNTELHVFATTTDEPWKLNLPNITYVPYG